MDGKRDGSRDTNNSNVMRSELETATFRKATGQRMATLLEIGCRISAEVKA